MNFMSTTPRWYRSALVFTVLGCCGVAVSSGCSRSDAPSAPAAPVLVLDALPSEPGLRAREVDFDGKVKLAGYRIKSRSMMRAGTPVTVTLYWQATTKLEPGYRMVTQLLDEAGERVLDLDNASPLRDQKDGHQILAPETWVPGKVYVDELSYTVPKTVKTWRVRLVSGFVKGEEKLGFTGAENFDGLAQVATSGTGVRDHSRGVKPPKSARLDRLDAKTKIKIDGKLDEEAWKNAAVLDIKESSASGHETKPTLSSGVRLLWNDQGIYTAFETHDVNLLGGFKPKDKDPAIWTKSAVEMVIAPGADDADKAYYEIIVSPQNLVFDSEYEEFKPPKKGEEASLGNTEWSSGIKSAVVVTGTIDKAEDQDDGYVVEAFIPWKSFTKAKTVPPALGDNWRVNFYAMHEQKLLSWAPLHAGVAPLGPRSGGRLLFAETGWQPAGAAPNAEAPAPAAENSAAAPAAEAPNKQAKAEKPPALVEHVQSAKPAAAPAPAPSAK